MYAARRCLQVCCSLPPRFQQGTGKARTAKRQAPQREGKRDEGAGQKDEQRCLKCCRPNECSSGGVAVAPCVWKQQFVMTWHGGPPSLDCDPGDHRPRRTLARKLSKLPRPK